MAPHFVVMWWYGLRGSYYGLTRPWWYRLQQSRWPFVMKATLLQVMLSNHASYQDALSCMRKLHAIELEILRDRIANVVDPMMRVRLQLDSEGTGNDFTYLLTAQVEIAPDMLASTSPAWTGDRVALVHKVSTLIAQRVESDMNVYIETGRMPKNVEQVRP